MKKKNNKKENEPEYILNALLKGFDVEIDLRVKSSKIYLGHDYCKFRINEKFLTNYKKKLWIHAKNTDALVYLKNHSARYNFFWHQEDLFTITSKGYVWTHYKSLKSLIRKNKISNKTICTLPEIYQINKNKLNIFHGICSDYILFYKNIKAF